MKPDKIVQGVGSFKTGRQFGMAYTASDASDTVHPKNGMPSATKHASQFLSSSFVCICRGMESHDRLS